MAPSAITFAPSKRFGGNIIEFYKKVQMKNFEFHLPERLHIENVDRTPIIN